MAAWIKVAIILAVLGGAGAAGWKGAALKYHAKIERLNTAHATAQAAAVTAAVDGQVKICQTNNKQITEATDNAAQIRIRSLAAKYNAASNELRRRAATGTAAACLSVASTPGTDTATPGNGAAGAGKVAGGDILTLGFDGDGNGEIALACQDFLDRLYTERGQ